MNDADEFKRLVHLRTGIAPGLLQCPREKSEMTPCIARDGEAAAAYGMTGAACVGCEERVEMLLKAEWAKHVTPPPATP